MVDTTRRQTPRWAPSLHLTALETTRLASHARFTGEDRVQGSSVTKLKSTEVFSYFFFFLLKKKKAYLIT